MFCSIILCGSATNSEDQAEAEMDRAADEAQRTHPKLLACYPVLSNDNQEGWNVLSIDQIQSILIM